MDVHGVVLNWNPIIDQRFCFPSYEARESKRKRKIEVRIGKDYRSQKSIRFLLLWRITICLGRIQRSFLSGVRRCCHPPKFSATRTTLFGRYESEASVHI